VNILQVIPQMHAGGAECTAVEVAEAVIANGGKAVVASAGGRLVADLNAIGARHVTLELTTKNPVSIWCNAGRLARLIKEAAIDLVHARSRAPAWSAYWASKRTLRPYVTTYHGFYKAGFGLKRWYNSIMARGDRVIANSKFIADHVHAEHGLDHAALRVIPRGVDLEFFDPDRVTPERVRGQRESWGVAPGQTAIVLAGRLTRWKGQSLMIDALTGSGLTASVVLVCLGEGEGKQGYQDELQAAARAAGLTLSLPGHTTDMPAAYMAADLVVCPSLAPEAFGRVAAEAQAMGARVIVADHGGAREVVEDGVTGWRVTPGDPNAWRGAVQAALALEAEAEQALTIAARTRVRMLFSKSQLQNATLRVYKELLH